MNGVISQIVLMLKIDAVQAFLKKQLIRIRTILFVVSLNISGPSSLEIFRVDPSTSLKDMITNDRDLRFRFPFEMENAEWGFRYSWCP